MYMLSPKMFKSNVQLYTDKLKEGINKKKPGHTYDCIEKNIQTRRNGQNECYICLTCVRHLRRKKMPPMSTMNGLRLAETDKEIRQQGLDLTELEASLIAKNIIFQKIYQLPKSRWTALKDRVINVPIEEDAIINTLQQLPRTPKEAGLIGVALKRKKEYKNTHKHQLINPLKLFIMLDKLKINKNPHYQFYEAYNEYQARCRTADPTGYNVVFQDDDNIDEITDVDYTTEFVVNDTPCIDDEKQIIDKEDEACKEEMELHTKDHVENFIDGDKQIIDKEGQTN